MTTECVTAEDNSVLAAADRLLPVVIFSIVLAFLPYSTRQLFLQWRGVQALDAQGVPKKMKMSGSAAAKTIRFSLGLLVGQVLVFATTKLDNGQRPILSVIRQVLVLVSPALLLFFNAFSLAMFLGRITKCSETLVTRTVVDLQTEKDSVLKATLAVGLRQESKYRHAPNWLCYTVAASLCMSVVISFSTGNEPETVLACALLSALGAGSWSTFVLPSTYGVSSSTGQLSLRNRLYMASLLLVNGLIYLFDEVKATVVDRQSAFKERKPGQDFFDALLSDKTLFQFMALAQILIWTSAAAISVEICAFVYRFEISRLNNADSEGAGESVSDSELLKQAIADTEAAQGDLIRRTDIRFWYDATPVSLSSPSLSVAKPSPSEMPVHRATTCSVILVYLLFLFEHLFYLSPLLRKKNAVLHWPLFPTEGQMVMTQWYFPSAICICPAVCICVALGASAWYCGGMRGVRQLWGYKEQWNIITPVEVLKLGCPATTASNETKERMKDEKPLQLSDSGGLHHADERKDVEEAAALLRDFLKLRSH
ncbi:hypothetical protein FA10DRAFT_304939 [Acaromyces ingoldii]|uniref:Uncharacterized protein n=1 Tax=Acaromyces ingoldii TaxID=215250 RepID=A0A316Y9W1_9BASI|nr:hypothetical protein FA10DRAFT_304939 [Acaromyces ingoldii]PWN86496.1 hypothetical protein FA10DRAFT_304939 [Acaromyces ingoldii]